MSMSAPSPINFPNTAPVTQLLSRPSPSPPLSPVEEVQEGYVPLRRGSVPRQQQPQPPARQLHLREHVGAIWRAPQQGGPGVRIPVLVRAIEHEDRVGDGGGGQDGHRPGARVAGLEPALVDEGSAVVTPGDASERGGGGGT